jgi:hypothetical protein
VNRQELEAVVWQQLGAYATVRIVDAILTAADSYALTEYGITADRRAVLAATPSRRLHYIPMDGDDGGEFACRPQGNATATTDPAAVTCIRCLRTDAYKDDVALREPA